MSLSMGKRHMLTYRSKSPNHVHQLSVCISKHYYASKGEVLKYQQKKMNVQLAEASSVEQRHMIVYCIRDHCSGVFYAEVDFCPLVPDIQGFLGRAWGAKKDYAFCGVPNIVSMPRSIKGVSPGIEETLSSAGIKVHEPGSGFESGVRDIRTIEDRLSYAIGKTTEFAKSEVKRIMISHSEQRARVGRLSKIELWRQNVEGLYMPTDDEA